MTKQIENQKGKSNIILWFFRTILLAPNKDKSPQSHHTSVHTFVPVIFDHTNYYINQNTSTCSGLDLWIFFYYIQIELI